jgi:ribosomal protein S27AE
MTVVERTCLRCARQFYVKPSQLNHGRGRYCSLSCAAGVAAKNRDSNGSRNPNWRGGVAGLKASVGRIRSYRQKYPQKYLAHRVAWNAIRTGVLKRKPCEVCGSNNVQAHHDDYSKPLSVRWLCKADHMRHHREFRESA